VHATAACKHTHHAQAGQHQGDRFRDRHRLRHQVDVIAAASHTGGQARQRQGILTRVQGAEVEPGHAGIRPVDAPGFILAQLAGAVAATALFTWLYPAPPAAAPVGGTVAPSDFAGRRPLHATTSMPELPLM